MTPRRIDDDCTFSYVNDSESWYSKVEGVPLGNPGVYVSARRDSGGSKWEFFARVAGFGRGISLTIYDDAFTAFTDIPGFFAGLSANPPETLAALVFLLDHMGAQDVTERVEPRAA